MLHKSCSRVSADADANSVVGIVVLGGCGCRDDDDDDEEEEEEEEEEEVPPTPLSVIFVQYK